MTTISQQDLLNVHRAAIQVGLVERRDALLSTLPRTIVAALVQAPTGYEQLLRDLADLNAIPSLADGSLPIRIWLETAAALAGQRPEADVFRRVLSQLPLPPHTALESEGVRSSRLTLQDLLQVHRAALSAALHADRHALMGALPSAVVVRIPSAPISADQLLFDLSTLNNSEPMEDGSSPLSIWLENAVALTDERSEAVTFRRALTRLPSRSQKTGLQRGGLLPLGRIHAVYRAVASRSIPIEREVLLSGVARQVVASLPLGSTPQTQILCDLHTLNSIGRMPDGTAPLEAWLAAAHAMMNASPEREVVGEALSAVRNVDARWQLLTRFTSWITRTFLAVLAIGVRPFDSAYSFLHARFADLVSFDLVLDGVLHTLVHDD